MIIIPVRRRLRMRFGKIKKGSKLFCHSSGKRMLLQMAAAQKL